MQRISITVTDVVWLFPAKYSVHFVDQELIIFFISFDGFRTDIHGSDAFTLGFLAFESDSV